MNLDYKKFIVGIIIFAIIIRIFLLFFAPLPMFADGVIRYLPDAEKVLRGDFSFNDVPLFTMVEAFWLFVFKGKILWLALKMTSLLFFFGILFLLPPLLAKMHLDKKEGLMVLALFLFSTWSLLLSVTVLQDMALTFFALCLFLNIENYFEKPSRKSIILLILLTFLMILSKLTGYLILCGFGLYILAKKEKFVNKVKSFFYLSIGALMTLPWLIKNYLLTGKIYLSNFTPPPIYIHQFAGYADYTIKAYHYFWEIPMPVKVGLNGLLLLFYNLYYLITLSITLIVTLLILAGIVRYFRKCKQYLLLMLPLGCFIFYWVFVIYWGPHDAGRYAFPFLLFLFIFPAKLIGNIKKRGVKNIAYLIIAAFCVLSIISAFGITIHMNEIDSQLLQINKVLKNSNVSDNFITNDEFTGSALSYYLKKPVIFGLPTNIRDMSIPCKGELLFSTKNFDVFKEKGEYRICRY
jgi:hypothetical protein